MLFASVPPASRRRQIVGLVVTLMVVAAAGALWWVSRPSPESQGRGYICVVSGSPSEQAAAEALCDRRHRDEAARKPLPARTMVDPTASRVWRALNDAVCAPEVGSCPSDHPATDRDVELVRRVLRDEGFPDAVVLPARPDDPAPPGAVIYAVALPGGICIVGDVEPGNGARPTDISGTLPSGRCLDT